jgi:alkylation response protein AidB-like acyl-CoA dehydrogenase
MMQAAGPLAQGLARAPAADPEDAAFDALAARLAARYSNYRKTSIYAGSNEIQRNIIAAMALGL